jgi:hypothetical protein
MEAEKPMTTRTKATKPASHADVTAKPRTAASIEAAASPAPIATAATTPAPATPAAPTAPIAPPPTDANIPSVPDGFEPTNGTNYRGMQPQKAELVALPLAIRDLGNFASYATVIGTTAPPVDEVLSTFEVANEWSTMRNASSAWDQYSRDQEGIAWTIMRSMMDRLKPAFVLAAKTNPSIATKYAGLATLLGAKTVSAQKAAATKKKNKQDEAEGKTATHGQVGKAREKAAAKEALAQQNAKPVSSAPVASPIAAPVVEAPIAAPASQPPALAAPPAPSGTPTGSNGASHS